MAETGRTLSNSRLEAFSDGVIAILVTIMVLELRIPDALASGFDRAALEELLPKLAAYALSFLVIAIMWVNHHALTRTLHQTEAGFVWLNNLLLFCMSLIPPTTAFLGGHPQSAWAAAAYGVALSMNAWTFTLMRAWLCDRETEDAELRRLHATVVRKSMVGASLYTAGIPLAFLSVYAAIACFVLVPAMFFLPERRNA